MAKEKVSEAEIKNKEFIFLYEIIGVCLILISLISVFRLGFLGKYGMLTFRLLFGDWYFLFIGLMSFLGVYFLFMHQRFIFNSIRYLGIILIVVSLIILSHFSMHNFVVQYESNPFTTTISLYLDYFKNSRNDMMIGGGIIGCALFYLFFFLVSKVGTIIICIILIFLGIVFLTKRTIIDFFKLIKKIFSKCFGGAFSLTKKIKDKIEIFNNDYKKEIVEKKKLKKKYLIKDTFNQDLEYSESISLVKKIKNTLNYLNIFYEDVTFIICYHLTAYFISTLEKVNYEVLRLSLNKIIKKDYLIRYDENNHIIIIEVSNNNPHYLSLYETINNKDSKDTLIIGKDDRNMYVTLNSSILILSNYSLIYRNYIYSLIILLNYLDIYKDIDIYLIDINKNMSDMKEIVTKYYDDINDIEDIKKELDDDLILLQNENMSNISEYNKKSSSRELIKLKYIFINGVEHIIKNFEFNKYLEYFIVSGSNIGYVFILGLNDNISENNIILRSLNYKLFLSNNFDLSRKYFGSQILDKISKNKEGLLKYKDQIIRISLLMVKKEELEKIKNISIK